MNTHLVCWSSELINHRFRCSTRRWNYGRRGRLDWYWGWGWSWGWGRNWSWGWGWGRNWGWSWSRSQRWRLNAKRAGAITEIDEVYWSCFSIEKLRRWKRRLQWGGGRKDICLETVSLQRVSMSGIDDTIQVRSPSVEQWRKSVRWWRNTTCKHGQFHILPHWGRGVAGSRRRVGVLRICIRQERRGFHSRIRSSECCRHYIKVNSVKGNIR